MGYYVNPTNMTKEQWLKENGRRIPDWKATGPGERPVCLVDNGPFTAAGIAYDDREAQAFSSPTDRRPKQWFAVATEKLIDVEPSVRAVLG